MLKNIINWFGMCPHETDEFIHWSNKDPKKDAEIYRNAWNILVHNKKQEEQLKLLLEAAKDITLKEAAEGSTEGSF